MQEERSVLKRFLQHKELPLAGEDYTLKLHLLDVPDEQTLWQVRTGDFYEELKNLGLSRGQRAGVTRILRDVGLVVLRDSDGRCLESYRLTVGDIRGMNDEDLLKLCWPKSAGVLRALFGKKEE